MTEENKDILSVTALTRRIKGLLERQVGSVWVEGEVSNCRVPASGHCYFTLKDASAQISAVIFKSDRRAGVVIKDGRMVRVNGKITVYEKGGNYQILVKLLEEAGQGDLFRKFEALKKKLADEGLFDSASKKKLPMLPQHIGIVTSRTGAAIKDILNVINRRFPNIHIILAPVKVQGEGAAEEIAGAIDDLNKMGNIDVLIVGRGGGSIEDLWAFNEEIVARAIHRSLIPVISAVGHEIDFTISDFAADLRAPTPSAAAELVVGCKDDFVNKIESIAVLMARRLRQTISEYSARFRSLEANYVFREPANIIKQYNIRLNGMRVTLLHHLSGSMSQAEQRLDDSSYRINSAVRTKSLRLESSLDQAGGSLRAMNPAKVLLRGYSITKDADGRCLTSASGVVSGAGIVTVLSNGEISSTVDRVNIAKINQLEDRKNGKEK